MPIVTCSQQKCSTPKKLLRLLPVRSLDQDSFDQDICAISEKWPPMPQCTGDNKTLIHNITYQPIDDDLIDYTADIIATARNSEEGKEGLSAFLEKRKPNF